jgi:hypothetical protein
VKIPRHQVIWIVAAKLVLSPNRPIVLALPSYRQPFTWKRATSTCREAAHRDVMILSAEVLGQRFSHSDRQRRAGTHPIADPGARREVRKIGQRDYRGDRNRLPVGIAFR